MSLADVRPFFRSRLNALGYKEHSDAFDDNNRPKNLLEKLYRIESGPLNGGPANQSVHTFDFDVTIQVTLRGGRDNVSLVDRGFVVAEEILADVLQVEVRNGTNIKDIIPGSISIAPFDVTDDNDCILSLGFTGVVICKF